VPLWCHKVFPPAQVRPFPPLVLLIRLSKIVPAAVATYHQSTLPPYPCQPLFSLFFGPPPVGPGPSPPVRRGPVLRHVGQWGPRIVRGRSGPPVRGHVKLGLSKIVRALAPGGHGDSIVNRPGNHKNFISFIFNDLRG
jgi:hypothetical protein